MILQWSTQQGIKLSDSFSCTAQGLLAGKKIIFYYLPYYWDLNGLTDQFSFLLVRILSFVRLTCFSFTPLKTRQWTRRQLNNDLVCPSRLNCLLLLCVILLKSHHPSYSIFSLFSSLEFMFRKSLLMHMGCSTKLSHHFLPKWRYIKISATMWDWAMQVFWAGSF